MLDNGSQVSNELLALLVVHVSFKVEHILLKLKLGIVLRLLFFFIGLKFVAVVVASRC